MNNIKKIFTVIAILSFITYNKKNITMEEKTPRNRNNIESVAHSFVHKFSTTIKNLCLDFVNKELTVKFFGLRRGKDIDKDKTEYIPLIPFSPLIMQFFQDGISQQEIGALQITTILDTPMFAATFKQDIIHGMPFDYLKKMLAPTKQQQYTKDDIETITKMVVFLHSQFRTKTTQDYRNLSLSVAEWSKQRILLHKELQKCDARHANTLAYQKAKDIDQAISYIAENYKNNMPSDNEYTNAETILIKESYEFLQNYIKNHDNTDLSPIIEDIKNNKIMIYDFITDKLYKNELQRVSLYCKNLQDELCSPAM